MTFQISRLYSDLFHRICKNPQYHYILDEMFFNLSYVTHRRTNTIPVNGKRMNVQLSDRGISTELALFRVHEPLSTEFLVLFLKKGYYCLDIGANMGYYALLISDFIGKEGKILAVEPHPENYNTLLANISINNLKNVTSFNVACSNYDGYGKMKIMRQSNWHRLLNDCEDGELQVKVQKVDTLTKDFHRLDFMRMDVEGHEDKIIEGAHKTIETFTPSLFLEFHPSFAGKDSTLALLKRLKDYDYEIDAFIPRFLDFPLIEKISHTKKMSIEDYMDRIEKADPVNGREANVFLSSN